MLQNCGVIKKNNLSAAVKKKVVNYSQSSCKPQNNLIGFRNPDVFSGLWKTIRLNLTLTDLLKYLADCLNYKAGLN